ncbi:RICIN domain-containing protein [Natronorubrum sp. FCH18a]
MDGSRAITSGYVADVLDASTDDGADVVQWSWWDGDNQKWDFNPS